MKTIITTLTFCLILALNTNVKSQIINTVAGIGLNGAYNTGNASHIATTASLNFPRGVAFDAIGNLFIADASNHCVRKVNTSGIISTITGTVSTYGGDGGQATAAFLMAPYDIAIDALGNLYISDATNNRIRMINTSGIITTIAGNGTAGFSGDGGQATSAQLSSPEGIAIDASGNLYIADYNNNRIRMVQNNGIISTVAGNGTQGFSGDGNAAVNAELYYPSGVTVDPSGNLYIVDHGNNRIRMVTSGSISTIAGTFSAGFSGDGGQASSAQLDQPKRITLDAVGNLYISDAAYNHIRMITNSTGIISTIAGNGVAGFSGDGGQATSAKINSPEGMAIDGSGNLYIADSGNGAVRKITCNCNTTNINYNQPVDINFIYPNPSNGYFNVNAKDATVTVIDCLGRTISSTKVNGAQSINIPDQGVYVIQIVQAGKVYTQRLINK